MVLLRQYLSKAGEGSVNLLGHGLLKPSTHKLSNCRHRAGLQGPYLFFETNQEDMAGKRLQLNT